MSRAMPKARLGCTYLQYPVLLALKPSHSRHWDLLNESFSQFSGAIPMIVPVYQRPALVPADVFLPVDSVRHYPERSNLARRPRPGGSSTRAYARAARWRSPPAPVAGHRYRALGRRPLSRPFGIIWAASGSSSSLTLPGVRDPG